MPGSDIVKVNGNGITEIHDVGSFIQRFKRMNRFLESNGSSNPTVRKNFKRRNELAEKMLALGQFNNQDAWEDVGTKDGFDPGRIEVYFGIYQKLKPDILLYVQNPEQWEANYLKLKNVTSQSVKEGVIEF